jgi:mRNA interferase MazF
VRGDVYRLLAPRAAQGHEQRGTRFAVVVQSDLLPLSTWLVVPTSTSARSADFRPEIDLNGKTTRILADQMTAVDPQRLGEFAGRLSAAELSDVDAALVTVLGLDN